MKKVKSGKWLMGIFAVCVGFTLVLSCGDDGEKAEALCTDSDGDGFYSTSGCGTEVDCDDSNASINPGATEICDGLDNDCDPATPDGSGQTPPLNTKQEGVCADSVQSCTGGNWQEDYSEIIDYEATDVSCDGLDNDCDGQFDEECGLIGYWPFEDGPNTITADLSGYGHDGIVDGATCTTDGKIGSAYYFDGVDDYIIIDDFEIPTTYSIEAWATFDTIQQGYLITKSPAQGDKQIYLYWYSNDLKYEISVGGTELGCGTPFSDTTNWHLITATVDSINEILSLWLDGDFKCDYEFTGSVDINTDSIYFGRRVWGSPQFGFEGKLDEVKIYNRILSPEEIDAHYQLK